MSGKDFTHRGYVGPEERYTLVGAQLFDFLLAQGLREHHRFLDIGCGSLRLGRLLIPFLMSENYHGLEPARNVLQEGLQKEVVSIFGQTFVDVKKPAFSYNGEFDFSAFDGRFDYILAFAVFIHCRRAQLETCLQGLRRLMGPSSVFLLDLSIGPQSREQGRHRKYDTASHQMTTYSIEDARRMIAAGGFTHSVVDLDPHPSAIAARKIFALKLVPENNGASGKDANTA